MNEKRSALRFVPYVVLVILAAAIVAFMVYLCQPTDGIEPFFDTTTTETTNTTADPTTTRIVTATNRYGEVVTQIITEPTTATTVGDAETAVTMPQKFTYEKAFEFDGWTIAFKDGVYDAAAQTLTLTVTELTTRERARPINYTLMIDEAAVEYTTAALPAPTIEEIYYEFDGLVNQAMQIKIRNVPADFEYVKINLQTYSIAEDATDGTGVIVNDTRYIAAYQLTTL